MKTKWSGEMFIPFVVAAVLATMVGIAGVTTQRDAGGALGGLGSGRGTTLGGDGHH